MTDRHRSDLLETARQRLPLPALMSLLGHSDRAKKSARCPFHDDHRPSFSVTQRPNGRWRFRCFGCGAAGDEVDFLARVKGLALRDAIREFKRLAGVEDNPPSPRRNARSWPVMRPGTTDEIVALARLRNLGVEALRLASDRGLLHFGRYHGHPSWFLVDDAGPVAQARRLDGGAWDNGAKALTLSGSRATWPVGASRLAGFSTVLFAEGGPDLLAAHHFIMVEDRAEDAAAVAVLGAGLRIATEAVPLFAGKRVRLVAHADEPGRRSVARWAGQLAAVADVIDAVDLAGLHRTDGHPVGDLNDLAAVDPDDFERSRELWMLVPSL